MTASIDQPHPSVRESRGHSFPEFEWLARFDPAYENARRGLTAAVWVPEDPALPIKYREVIASVILAMRGYHTIDAHLRRAIENGATVRQLVEALQTATVPGGMTCLHFALPHLKALHEEYGDAPNADDSDAGAAKTAGHAMTVWEWLADFDPDFNSARTAYTATVWTPSNPVLPVKVREMIAAAVLAYRGYPTVEAHLRRAVQEGASLREVVEAMEVAAMPGGAPCLHFALPHLMKLADDIEAGRL